MLRSSLIAFLLITCIPYWGYSQRKTVDAPIPQEEFNRIERVRKLFNQYHIYEGERILKGYIKEHPNNPYYREALVQLQQQVLNRIKKANQFLDDMEVNNTDSWDESGSVEENLAKPILLGNNSPKTNEKKVKTTTTIPTATELAYGFNASKVATKVNVGIITSSPCPMPATARAVVSAVVPLLTTWACLTCMRFARAASSSLVFQCPLRIPSKP